MKLAGRLTWTASVAIVALVALLAIPKLSTTRALTIWVVIATGLVLLLIIRHSRERGGPEPPSRFEQALRGRKPAVSQPERHNLPLAFSVASHRATRATCPAPSQSDLWPSVLRG